MRFNTVTIERAGHLSRGRQPAKTPKLVLLHGYRVVAPVPQPDPGAGRALSRHRARLPRLRKLTVPDPREFAYTFERLPTTRRSWPRSGSRVGCTCTDYGGPVGFRLATGGSGWTG